MDVAFVIADADRCGTVDENEFINLYRLVKKGDVKGIGGSLAAEEEEEEKEAALTPLSGESAIRRFTKGVDAIFMGSVRARLDADATFKAKATKAAKEAVAKSRAARRTAAEAAAAATEMKREIPDGDEDEESNLGSLGAEEKKEADKPTTLAEMEGTAAASSGRKTIWNAQFNRIKFTTGHVTFWSCRAQKKRENFLTYTKRMYVEK